VTAAGRRAAEDQEGEAGGRGVRRGAREGALARLCFAAPGGLVWLSCLAWSRGGGGAGFFTSRSPQRW
jgi:hypothetical protein